MKFVLVCGKRTEAIKGARGICPGCGSELFAKCGTIKVKHWAHKGNSNCDPWWEPETEWHRFWKNNFPAEWQEIVLHDERTREKHIADVRTSNGLVIEFQHSHIDPIERIKRENFYKEMVWVVDGTRLKRDYLRFLKGASSFRIANNSRFFIIDSPEETFPVTWIGSSVPVIFDFQGAESIIDLKDLQNSLFCLFSKQNKSEAKLVIFSRESFISKTIDGEWFRKQQEPQKQNAKPPIKSKTMFRESTHYYDPSKNRFIKKRRL